MKHETKPTTKQPTPPETEAVKTAEAPSAADGFDQLDQEEQVQVLAKQIGMLNEMMERTRIKEYIEHLNNPKRMFWKSFLSGVSRGVGMAVGFTILGALLLEVLKLVANNHIPFLSQFIAEIIKTVDNYLSVAVFWMP